MPGLFGVIAKKPNISRAELRAMAMRMADSMQAQPWLRTEVWGDDAFCGGRVHLGVLNPDPQPMVADEGLSRIWFDGEVYLSPEKCGATPTPAEASAWLSQRSLTDVEGVFTLTCYTPANRQLTIANDRFGFRPLYVTQTDEWFAYAAEVKALLAIRDKLPDVDEIALRQFFGFGHMLSDRTWWTGISVVPPATVWRISPDTQMRSEYWSFAQIRRDPAPERDVQDELGRLWAQSIRQRVKPGTMPLLLSGGFDSRLVLAEVRKQGSDVIAITFGDPRCTDMTIAQQCAQIARVAHHALPLTAENWWHGREEAIWQTDGLINCLDLHVSLASDQMHVGNCHTLTNLSGDTLFGGSKLAGVSSDDWAMHPEKFLSHMYDEAPNPFFTRGEVISASVADATPDMTGPSSDCFIFRQRQRRFILYGGLAFAPYSDTVNPAATLPIVRLMLGSLTDEQRIKNKFYNPFLVRKYGEYFAEVPWQATGRGLAESLPKRVLRGIKGVMGGAREDAFADYDTFARDAMTREKLLESTLVVDEVLKGAARRALADEKRPLGAYALMAIVGFETYFRRAAGMPRLPGIGATLSAASPTV